MKFIFIFCFLIHSPFCNNSQEVEVPSYFETLYELMDADQFYDIEHFSSLATENYDLLITNYWYRWKNKAVKNNIIKLFYYVKNFFKNENIDENIDEEIVVTNTLDSNKININEKLLTEDEVEAKKFLNKLKIYHSKNLYEIIENKMYLFKKKPTKINEKRDSENLFIKADVKRSRID